MILAAKENEMFVGDEGCHLSFQECSFLFSLLGILFYIKGSEIGCCREVCHKKVTVLFFTAILNDNVQRRCEIYTIFLPICTRKDVKFPELSHIEIISSC
jgi:hypothetical protein